MNETTGGQYRPVGWRTALSIERRVILVLVALAAVVWWQAWRVSVRDLTVTFVDVGQGDCAIIHAPNGRTVLIDAGGRPRQANDSDNVGRWVVVPELYREGIRKLDAIIVTHPHDDHVGGMAEVVEQVPVDMALSYTPEGTTPAYDKFLEAARAHKVRMIMARPGQVLNLGAGIRAEVLYPRQPITDSDDDQNNDSVVVRVIYGRISFLFAGDIEEEGEAQLLTQAPNLDSIVLKAPHHGSMDSLAPEFLQTVHPQWTVISVGRNNSFGHPDQQTLTRLYRQGTRIFRTDEMGTIVMHTDGRRLTAEWGQPGMEKYAEIKE
jgi:competence protein ComEC